MASEEQASPRQRPRRHGPARWLALLAAALALLAASQVLWLWQTWPVRHLIAPPAQPATLASRQ